MSLTGGQKGEEEEDEEEEEEEEEEVKDWKLGGNGAGMSRVVIDGRRWKADLITDIFLRVRAAGIRWIPLFVYKNGTALEILSQQVVFSVGFYYYYYLFHFFQDWKGGFAC